MNEEAKRELIQLLERWRDDDEPLVEAIADTLETYRRVDLQEAGRRVVDTVIEVLDREL